MKNDNKGFTLVEMLVVVGIIALLSITIGFSAHTFTNNAEKNSFKTTMMEVFNAASNYAELSTSSCASGCSVTLQKLIENGMVSKDILNKKNPIYKDRNFLGSDSLTVTRVAGVKDVEYPCSSNSAYSLKMNNIDNYSSSGNWGKC